MKELISAGIVVFNKENYEIKYLLLHYPHGHWDLAKGKIEAGETKKEAALRELKEETGLEARIIPGFEESFSYHFTGVDDISSRKTIYFFIGEVESMEVTLSHEHVDYAWLTFDKVLERLTFENAKKLIKKAHHFLQNS